MARARIHISSLALALLMLPAAADDGFGPEATEAEVARLSAVCVPEEQALTEWEWAVTVDEAYALACEAAGQELDRENPRYRVPTAAVGFRTPPESAPLLSYWVSAEHGGLQAIRGQSVYWSSGGLLSTQALLALARDAVERHFPGDVEVEDWKWSLEEDALAHCVYMNAVAAWHGEVPTMPRPAVSIRIDRELGIVRYYFQHTYFERLEAEPAVSYEEALATLEAQAGIGALELTTTSARYPGLDPWATYLFHGPEELYYNICFDGPTPGYGRVDALTGEVTDLVLVPESPAAETADPAVDPTDPVLTDPPVMNE